MRPVRRSNADRSACACSCVHSYPNAQDTVTAIHVTVYSALSVSGTTNTAPSTSLWFVRCAVVAGRLRIPRHRSHILGASCPEYPRRARGGLRKLVVYASRMKMVATACRLKRSPGCFHVATNSAAMRRTSQCLSMLPQRSMRLLSKE